jgi:hypothetical protein
MESFDDCTMPTGYRLDVPSEILIKGRPERLPSGLPFILGPLERIELATQGSGIPVVYSLLFALIACYCLKCLIPHQNWFYPFAVVSICFSQSLAASCCVVILWSRELPAYRVYLYGMAVSVCICGKGTGVVDYIPSLLRRNRRSRTLFHRSKLPLVPSVRLSITRGYTIYFISGAVTRFVIMVLAR